MNIHTTIARSIATSIAASCLLLAHLPAQDPCPNQGVQRVESKISYGPVRKCGDGIILQQGGVTVRNNGGACPTFAIYEPPHDKPTPKQGFYTVDAGTVPVLMLEFECSNRYLLFFIPVGSSCEITRRANLAGIQNYREVSCSTRFRNPQPELQTGLPTQGAVQGRAPVRGSR